LIRISGPAPDGSRTVVATPTPTVRGHGDLTEECRADLSARSRLAVRLKSPRPLLLAGAPCWLSATNRSYPWARDLERLTDPGAGVLIALSQVLVDHASLLATNIPALDAHTVYTGLARGTPSVTMAAIVPVCKAIYTTSGTAQHWRFATTRRISSRKGKALACHVMRMVARGTRPSALARLWIAGLPQRTVLRSALPFYALLARRALVLALIVFAVVTSRTDIVALPAIIDRHNSIDAFATAACVAAPVELRGAPLSVRLTFPTPHPGRDKNPREPANQPVCAA